MKVIKTTIIVFLCILFLFIANFTFLNNPVGAIIAHKKIIAYVDETFPDIDFNVNFPKYLLQVDGIAYEAKAYVNNDKNIEFKIFYSSSFSFFSDEYSELLNSFITPLFEKEFGDNLNEVYVSRYQSGRSTLTEKSIVGIKFYVEKFDPEYISEIIDTCNSIIQHNEFIHLNGYAYESYEFYFTKSDNSRFNILHIKPEHIDENLTFIIIEMQDDLRNNDSGYYKDTGIFYNEIQYLGSQPR